MQGSRSRICLKICLGVFLFCGIVPSFESEAFGAKRATKTATKKKKKAPDSPPAEAAEPSEESSSLAGEQKSSAKKYILGNIGLAPQPLIGIGATAGMPSSAGRALEASVTMANGKKGVVAARIIHFGGRYRFPFMKMGYYAGGAGLRMASGAWNVLSLGGYEYPTSSSLNAVTLDGAVGAQTKFGSFIVSADVLGISFPLFKLGVKKSAIQESDVDPDDEKKQQAAFDSLAAGINMNILKVGVGINF